MKSVVIDSLVAWKLSSRCIRTCQRKGDYCLVDRHSSTRTQLQRQSFDQEEVRNVCRLSSKGRNFSRRFDADLFNVRTHRNGEEEHAFFVVHHMREHRRRAQKSSEPCIDDFSTVHPRLGDAHVTRASVLNFSAFSNHSSLFSAKTLLHQVIS